MTSISQQILANHQVRNTDKQKEDFRDFMKDKFPKIIVEPESDSSTHNLVLGNIETAKAIFAAHYDTPRCQLRSTLSFPRNYRLTLAYRIIRAILDTAAMLLSSTLIYLYTNNLFLSILCLLAVFAIMLAAFYTGLYPNPRNANDNSSGVIALIELYASLNDYEKSQFAFVFFDNEERKFLGSKLFKELHPNINLDHKLLINFDCISDGNHVLIVLNNNANTFYRKEFEQCFTSDIDREIHIEERRKKVHIESDHDSFGTGVGITVLRKKGDLLYQSRIHTARDTVFEYENIEHLVEGSKHLINNLCKPPVE